MKQESNTRICPSALSPSRPSPLESPVVPLALSLYLVCSMSPRSALATLAKSAATAGTSHLNLSSCIRAQQLTFLSRLTPTIKPLLPFCTVTARPVICTPSCTFSAASRAYSTDSVPSSSASSSRQGPPGSRLYSPPTSYLSSHINQLLAPLNLSKPLSQDVLEQALTHKSAVSKGRSITAHGEQAGQKHGERLGFVGEFSSYYPRCTLRAGAVHGRWLELGGESPRK